MMMALGGHEGADAEMNSYNLPESVGAWRRPEAARTIDSTNIFKYMNGAGELYLGYRFKRLEVFDYTSENQDNILVELYFMETSDDAFGLLSLDWGGEPASFHALPASPASSPAASPAANAPNQSVASWPGALYGAGLLRAWSGNLYIRIMAFRETPVSREAVLALGKAITANRKRSPEPELLKRLSPLVGSSWKLRRDRMSFFRSHLALNSIYYLSHENILDFDLSAEAVIAPYERTSSAGGGSRAQVLLVKYENSGRARKALDRFHDAYLPEHGKEFTADSPGKSPSFFKVEDGWMGYEWIDNVVVFVFKCPDRESAGAIIRENTANSRRKP